MGVDWTVGQCHSWGVGVQARIQGERTPPPFIEKIGEQPPPPGQRGAHLSALLVHHSDSMPPPKIHTGWGGGGWDGCGSGDLSLEST